MKKKSKDRFDQYFEAMRGYRPIARIPEPPPRELTPEEKEKRKAEELEQKKRDEEFAAKREIFNANAAHFHEYKNLGWANGWQKTPEIVKNCDHKYPDKGTIDDPSHRGYENKVFCAKCGYAYRYDSSN